MNIKIDLSKVKTKDYVAFLICPPEMQLVALVAMLDSAVDGGIQERPLTELPAVLSQALKVLTELGEDINLAVGSMQQYLKDDTKKKKRLGE